MTSAAIVALRTRILTNTLTATDQAALGDALEAMAPDFPSPDEISNSIVDARLARTWIAPLYNIQAEGSGPPVPPAQPGFLIFADIATMAAFDTSALTSPGQQAFVQSNGSLWSLKPAAELPAPADGITIVTATPNTNQWLRENNSPEVAAWRRVQQWYVDPENTSGHASDENVGNDVTRPLLTKAEIYRRWGYTWSPDIDVGAVTITPISDDLDNTDPAFFAPNLINGSRLIIQGISTPVYDGTLASVSAKNRASNTNLSAAFTGDTSDIGIGDLVINFTRGNSRALVALDMGEGINMLTQPMTPYEDLTQFPGSQTEVDTWADGDHVQVFQQRRCNLPYVGGNVGNIPGGNGNNVIVGQLRIPDASDFSGSPCNVDVGAGVVFVDCFNDRTWSFDGASTLQGAWMLGCMSLLPTDIGTADSYTGVFVSAGAFDTMNAPVGLEMTNDTIVFTALNAGTCSLVNIFLNAACTLSVFGGACTVSAGVLYGDFVVNVESGSLVYNGDPATSLVGVTGGDQLFIGQSNQAYSNASPAGVTSTHRLAMTLASLHAAAGDAGFGDLAYVPGVGAICASGVAP